MRTARHFRVRTFFTFPLLPGLTRGADVEFPGVY